MNTLASTAVATVLGKGARKQQEAVLTGKRLKSGHCELRLGRRSQTVRKPLQFAVLAELLFRRPKKVA